MTAASDDVVADDAVEQQGRQQDAVAGFVAASDVLREHQRLLLRFSC